MPLHMRIPKLKGFNNPFRVEYQAVNLNVLDGTGLDSITPADLHARRPDPQRRTGEGARPAGDLP